MKALILVGGFGTRLRPLTLALPKPMVPFVNKPMIIHQVEALKAAGVSEVILAVAYRPEAMREEMERWGAELDVKFIFSHETEPLGTAGPLALAREILMEDDEPFFVLNSDVTCKFPLRELLQFHRNHGKEGTILVTRVEQWDKYGVVVYDKHNGQIKQFVEKPKNFVGDQINSGIYILNKTVLNRIKLEKTSIETQIFPAMATQGQLFAMELEGFWMDIGQPKDYLAGLDVFLPHLAGKANNLLMCRTDAEKKKINLHGCVVVHPTAVIAEGAEIGPNVTIGANCRIGPCARLVNCAIFDNTVVGKGSFISKSIIGWNNVIGSWTHIENVTVTGDDVTIASNLIINGAKILPNKSVKEHVKEPEVIM